MIAGYGTKQDNLIAIGIGTEIWFGLYSIYLSIGILFGVLYAQFHLKNPNMFKDVFKLSIYTSIFFAIIISLIMLFLSPKLVQLFSLTKHNMHIKKIELISIKYLKILSFGNIFLSFSFLMINPLIMMGKTNYLLIVSIFSLISNVLMDYIFIYVCNWGAKGASLSTVLSYIIQFLISFYLFWINKKEFKNIGNIFSIKKESIIIFLKRIGMIFSIPIFTWSLVLITILWSNMYGINLVKSLSIGYAISNIMFTIFPAINQSIKIMIAKELGKNNFKNALIISKHLIKVVLTITIIISLIGILFAFTLPSLLLNNSIALNNTKWMILIYSLALIPYVINAYYLDILEAGGKQLMPMFLNYLSQLWLVIPLMILFGHWGIGLNFKETMLISQTSSIFTSIASYFVYKQNKWLINLNKHI